MEELPFTHVLQTINLIRESFDQSVEVYTSGSCVKLCMILKHIYPKGRILYDANHAIFEYSDGQCFDILGFATKTEKHIPIEEYGLLQSFELMNLKYSKKLG